MNNTPLPHIFVGIDLVLLIQLVKLLTVFACLMAFIHKVRNIFHRIA